MSNIYFRPWVGDNYQESAGVFGKRILALGESHYVDSSNPPEQLPELTIEAIKWQISGEKSYAFFTKITNIFLGKEGTRTPEDKETFWHSVAFANFIQERVGGGPRERPSEEMWDKGRQAFPEMLSELRPHLVVVFGFELWNNLPASEHKGPDIVDVQSDSKTTRFYSHPAGKALAFRMKHPSGQGYVHSDWGPGLKEAIAKAPSD